MTPPAPRANPDLIGHAQPWSKLQSAMAGGRLAHAWLLVGPRGIGKATLAYRFARLLLARGGDDPQDPGSAVFRQVAKGSHPDLHVLEREANPQGKLRAEITVDAVRAASGKLQATAAQGGRRLLLIDSADELNRNAANAMLKLLEEPPAGVVQLLVCHRPGAMPATIASRCARLRLDALKLADVAELLVGWGIVPDKATGDRLAAFSRGSPGRALRLHESAALEAYGDILVRFGTTGGVAARLALVDRLLGLVDKEGFGFAIDMLRDLAERGARVGAGGTLAVEIVPDERKRLAALAEGGGLDRVLALWDKLSRVSGRVEALNLDPGQALLEIVGDVVA